MKEYTILAIALALHCARFPRCYFAEIVHGAFVTLGHHCIFVRFALSNIDVNAFGPSPLSATIGVYVIYLSKQLQNIMVYCPIASSSLLTLYSALFCSTLLPESPGASLTFGRLQADPLGGSGGWGA